MGYIDKKRKTIALSFGLFIILIIFFLGIIGNKIIDVNKLTKEVSVYEKSKIEEYLQNSLYHQNNSINVIEECWMNYIIDTPYNGKDPTAYIQQFIDSTIAPHTNIAVSSVIIVSQDKNTILFSGHKKADYDHIHELLYNKDLQDNILYILNGDKDKPFGTQDRFYVARKTLILDKDIKIYVYIGFLEKIMYSNFINALSLDTIEEIRYQTQTILLFIIIFYGDVYWFWNVSIILYEIFSRKGV